MKAASSGFRWVAADGLPEYAEARQQSALLPSKMPLRSGSCSLLSTDFSVCPTSATPFEVYIERAFTEEIDRIPAYYGERDGGFWVAVKGDKVVGAFGVERASKDAMELRRMYVDPSARRQGIARLMLQFAENECRRRRVKRPELSTAEIQYAAIPLYKNAGCRLVGEKTVKTLSNKTVGSGIRRYYLEKTL